MSKISKKGEYDNPFTNSKLKHYFHELSKEETEFRGEAPSIELSGNKQDTKDEEWVALLVATAMVVGGSLVLLLGLAWLL